ncbi:GyrI-like domain-containing protein [Paenibacillus beijingensis]|uniref:AraC family transcriptional regulator n=1 Tax=Paenibacillus beijingensis TaxID=1126833 RepID=A0A0D5ND68_9BACL|nr:GyrI-like domain-containing protein [Paenibacillus beijingensis]AJY73339.1 AraC family transcriptional regulator [Paenibacillus beijingensis]
MVNCTLVTKPALNLVGINYCGPYSSFPDESIRLQSEFLSRKHELNDAALSTALYCPYFGNEVFATYWVALEVHHMEQLPPGMVQIRLPSRRYVMAECTNKRIGEGYDLLFSWMAEQGLRKNDAAVSLEIFYVDEHWEEKPVELLVPLDEPALE